jgi:hypothetical protein
MDVPQDISDLGSLSEEQMRLYRDDQEYRLEVDTVILRNKNAARAGTSMSYSGRQGVMEQGGAAPAVVARARPLRSSKYPAAEQSSLLKAMMGASATKVREMTPADRDVKFESLCDKLGLPEEREARMSFYFSVIAWITMNTASTENGIDSVVGERYSSQEMLEHFDHDLRPFARALAPDAKSFITLIADTQDHPLHDRVMALARKYGVSKTPWLIYDGIDAAKITERENSIAEDVKFARLNGGGARSQGPSRVMRGAPRRDQDDRRE